MGDLCSSHQAGEGCTHALKARPLPASPCSRCQRESCPRTCLLLPAGCGTVRLRKPREPQTEPQTQPQTEMCSSCPPAQRQGSWQVRGGGRKEQSVYILKEDKVRNISVTCLRCGNSVNHALLSQPACVPMQLRTPPIPFSSHPPALPPGPRQPARHQPSSHRAGFTGGRTHNVKRQSPVKQIREATNTRHHRCLHAGLVGVVLSMQVP